MGACILRRGWGNRIWVFVRTILYEIMRDTVEVPLQLRRKGAGGLSIARSNWGGSGIYPFISISLSRALRGESMRTHHP